MDDFINIKFDDKQIQKGLGDLINKQLDFAKAQALTAIAQKVQQAEVRGIQSTFENPTSFTQHSVGIIKARKSTMQAVVYLKDKAADYLEPYEFGGVHHLNSKALLNPKDISLNQYGNLPRATLARLKGRPDIFIGIIQTKAGPINGVWQRSMSIAHAKVAGKKGRKLTRANTTGALKLLIRFGDALPVHKHLNWFKRAGRVVSMYQARALEDAMAQALATAE